MTLTIFSAGDDCVRSDILIALRSPTRAAQVLAAAASEEEAYPSSGFAVKDRNVLTPCLVPARGCVFETAQQLKTPYRERGMWRESATEAHCLACCNALKRMPSAFDAYAKPRS